MRMWMVDPTVMCQKHLMGEHVEIHMLVGTINKNKSIDGFIANDLLEPQNIIERHEELAIEMKRRGYNHKSPLPEIIGKIIHQEIDKEKSFNDLINRCEVCRKRAMSNDY